MQDLLLALLSSNLRYWYDREEIGIHDPNWATMVEEPIRLSACLLFVRSSNSIACGNCGYELEVARRHNRVVVVADLPSAPRDYDPVGSIAFTWSEDRDALLATLAHHAD